MAIVVVATVFVDGVAVEVDLAHRFWRDLLESAALIAEPDGDAILNRTSAGLPGVQGGPSIDLRDALDATHLGEHHSEKVGELIEPAITVWTA